MRETPDQLPHAGNQSIQPHLKIPARLKGSSFVMNIIMHERLEGKDLNLLERKKGNPFNDALP